MSVAKRILYVALCFLLLITAVCWGYWSYRQYRSFQTPIHREATSLIRIHVDGIIRDIAWNALWNNAYYRETPARQSTMFDTNAWKRIGARVPANLFLYQVEHRLSDEFPDVYFGSVEVHDSTALAAWLHGRLGMEVGNSSYGTVASSERALVIIQPQQALFALSLTKPTADLSLLANVLINMLEKHDGTVAVNKSDFGEIANNNDQIYGLGAHQFAIRFKKGILSFSGQYEMEHAPGTLEGTPHFADSNTASLWIQGGLTDFLQGRKFDIDGYTLHGDSLLHHYNGHVAMEWKSVVMQQDTIISYDYDDDFELVEMEEIVDKLVPEMYCSISADTTLIDYLQAQGILQGPNNTITHNAFPLFRASVSSLPSGYVQLHTPGQTRALPELSPSRHELVYLQIDFNKLQAVDLPPVLTPYTQAADLLELSGRPVADNHVVVHGTLRMKNTRLHSLVQLLALR